MCAILGADIPEVDFLVVLHHSAVVLAVKVTSSPSSKSDLVFDPSTDFLTTLEIVTSHESFPRCGTTRVCTSLGPRPFLYVPMRMRRERGGAGKKGSGDTA